MPAPCAYHVLAVPSAAVKLLCLAALVLVLERGRVIGTVDLSAPGASAPYALEVPPGDIVVSAVLDSRRELADTLFGAGGVGVWVLFFMTSVSVGESFHDSQPTRRVGRAKQGPPNTR